MLRMLPAPLACRALLAAIRRHAWTFAGSGTFVAVAGRPTRLAITGNPLCHDEPRSDTPHCAYYAATFERLFRVLVHPRSTVIEVACEARGEDACRFEIAWQRAPVTATRAPSLRRAARWDRCRCRATSVRSWRSGHQLALLGEGGTVRSRPAMRSPSRTFKPISTKLVAPAMSSMI